jgi:putative regulator of septum formation
MSEQALDPADSPASIVGPAEPGHMFPDVPGGSDLVAKRLMQAALVIVGLLIAAVVAVAITIAANPAPRQLTVDQYRAGDCLLGPPLPVAAGSSWPYLVTVVPCTQRHSAEVFFTAHLWPRSLAFPGAQSANDQMTTVCENAFGSYDGRPWPASAFQILVIGPGKAEWSRGVRSVQCVAYEPIGPVDYSIKGSHN